MDDFWDLQLQLRRRCAVRGAIGRYGGWLRFDDSEMLEDVVRINGRNCMSPKVVVDNYYNEEKIG